MRNLRIKFNKDYLGPDELSITAYDNLKALWRGAVRSSIIAMVQNMKVDTGMAMASVLPLAGKVRAQTIIYNYIMQWRAYNKTTYKRGYTTLEGEYVSSGFKSVAQGIREGEREIPGAPYGVDVGTINNPVLRYDFSIKVFQHAFHEGKWDSLKAARDGFNAHMKANFKFYINAKVILKAMVSGKRMGSARLSENVSNYEDRG